AVYLARRTRSGARVSQPQEFFRGRFGHRAHAFSAPNRAGLSVVWSLRRLSVSASRLFRTAGLEAATGWGTVGAHGGSEICGGSRRRVATPIRLSLQNYAALCGASLCAFGHIRQ